MNHNENSGNRDGEKMHTVILDREATIEAQKIAEVRWHRTKQSLDAVSTGTKGKIAITNFLKEKGFEVQTKFQDPTDWDTSDLISNSIRMVVRSWKEQNWDDWGRCIPVDDVKKISNATDVVIWATVNDLSTGETIVTIRGFNWSSEAELWPTEITGPDTNKVRNHQNTVDDILPMEWLIPEDSQECSPKKRRIIAICGEMDPGQVEHLISSGFRIVNPDEKRMHLALSVKRDSTNANLLFAQREYAIQEKSLTKFLTKIAGFDRANSPENLVSNMGKFDSLALCFDEPETVILRSSLAQTLAGKSYAVEQELDFECEYCGDSDSTTIWPEATREYFECRSKCKCCGLLFLEAKTPEHQHHVFRTYVRTEESLREDTPIAVVNVRRESEIAYLRSIGAEIWAPKPIRIGIPTNLAGMISYPKYKDREDRRSENNLVTGEVESGVKLCVYSEKNHQLSDRDIQQIAKDSDLIPVGVYDLVNSQVEFIVHGGATGQPTSISETAEIEKELIGKIYKTTIGEFGFRELLLGAVSRLEGSQLQSGVVIHGVSSPEELQFVRQCFPKVRLLTILSSGSVPKTAPGPLESQPGLKDWVRRDLDKPSHYEGDWIDHQSFGIGTVLSIRNKFGRDILKVQFESGVLRELDSTSLTFSVIRDKH
jgi:hypothetical protein